LLESEVNLSCFPAENLVSITKKVSSKKGQEAEQLNSPSKTSERIKFDGRACESAAKWIWWPASETKAFFD
jgi:hypothetical protein